VQMTLAHDVASGLAYLHTELSMLHHDIKSANVLLFQTKTRLAAKMADFGLATGVSGESTLMQTKSTAINAAAGTQIYRAHPRPLTTSTTSAQRSTRTRSCCMSC